MFTSQRAMVNNAQGIASCREKKTSARGAADIADFARLGGRLILQECQEATVAQPLNAPRSKR